MKKIILAAALVLAGTPAMAGQASCRGALEFLSATLRYQAELARRVATTNAYWSPDAIATESEALADDAQKVELQCAAELGAR
jgi:hypothetical protein